MRNHHVSGIIRGISDTYAILSEYMHNTLILIANINKYHNDDGTAVVRDGFNATYSVTGELQLVRCLTDGIESPNTIATHTIWLFI
jgi:hypothetical protein